MARFDPAVELRLIWLNTEEELLTKWKLYQDFDPLVRLFGTNEDGSNKSVRSSSSPKVNPASMEAALMRFIPEG